MKHRLNEWKINEWVGLDKLALAVLLMLVVVLRWAT